MTWVSNLVVIQGVGSVILLSSIIIGMSIMQSLTATRMKNILLTLPDSVQGSSYFQHAKEYVERRHLGSTVSGHSFILPVFVLVLVTISCSILTYFGAWWIGAVHTDPLSSIYVTPSYVLGGMFAASPSLLDQSLSQSSSSINLIQYQSRVLFVGAITFLGVYIFTVTQLFRRINNGDTQPITYYYYSIRIVVACLAAGIFFHILYSFGLLSGTSAVGLSVTLGFVVGMNPYLWIDSVYTWCVKKLPQAIGLQSTVKKAPAQLAEYLPLSLIVGFGDGEIARLEELDILECQRLKNENPIILWLRTSYSIFLILDWVAEAYLASFLGANKFSEARKRWIINIFQYKVMLEQNVDQLSKLIGIEKEILELHSEYLKADPVFFRLKQLRDCLTDSASTTQSTTNNSNQI